MIQTSHVLLWLSIVVYFEFCAASSVNCSDEFNKSCNSSQYHCDIDKLCKPRDRRCTSSPSCVYTNGTETAGCNCDASGLRCKVTKGSYRLLSKKRQIRLEHDFIEYKGFVWEYGCYGTRILDMNDPLFLLQRPNTSKTKIIGKSSCSYSDARLFIEHTSNIYTRAGYSLLFNNCQHFATEFSRWLLDDCPSNGKSVAIDSRHI